MEIEEERSYHCSHRSYAPAICSLRLRIMSPYAYCCIRSWINRSLSLAAHNRILEIDDLRNIDVHGTSESIQGSLSSFYFQ